MKRKGKAKTILTAVLVMIIVVLYYHFLTKPHHYASAPEPEESYENVPMPDSLHPVVEERADELVRRAAAKGIDVIITDGFRTIEEQDELYAQGRTKPGRIVTTVKGGESYHNYGLAVDFAIRLPSGKVIWDLKYDGNKNGKADWFEIVAIAKELGFTWGGDWEDFKDFPHLQMDFGLTIEDLKRGKRPPENITVAENKTASK